MFSSNAVMKGSLLLDGFVRAIWVPVKSQGVRTLAIAPFGEPIPPEEAALAAAGERRRPPPPGRARPAISEEGMRLLAFLAPGEKHRVHFGTAD